MEELLQTTLCYLERDGQYLMLHRVKKERDVNKDKWIGVGGKFGTRRGRPGLRTAEVREETGLTMQEPDYRASSTFTARPGSPSASTCSPAGSLPACRRSATRATWPGWTRTRWRRCPSGPGTRSFSDC